MPISQKIIKFLDENKVKHETVSHRTVYTAFDKAATLRVKPNMVGKTLVLKTDGGLAIILIPGNKNFDKKKLKKAVFVSETVMKNKFKGIKMGVVPPFGQIWKLQTFVDRALLKEKSIFVNSGIYEASFKLSPKVFEKLGAIAGNFSKAK